MKRLLNALYILTPESYARLEGENVVIQQDDKIAARFPLHTLESIVCFNYAGASPQLMGTCAQAGIGLSFFTPSGKFLAPVTGEISGNVSLRK